MSKTLSRVVMAMVLVAGIAFLLEMMKRSGFRDPFENSAMLLVLTVPILVVILVVWLVVALCRSVIGRPKQAAAQNDELMREIRSLRAEVSRSSPPARAAATAAVYRRTLPTASRAVPPPPLRVKCPECQHVFTTAPGGGTVSCPSCQAQLSVE